MFLTRTSRRIISWNQIIRPIENQRLSRGSWYRVSLLKASTAAQYTLYPSMVQLYGGFRSHGGTPSPQSSPSIWKHLHFRKPHFWSTHHEAGKQGRPLAVPWCIPGILKFYVSSFNDIHVIMIISMWSCIPIANMKKWTPMTSSMLHLDMFSTLIAITRNRSPSTRRSSS